MLIQTTRRRAFPRARVPVFVPWLRNLWVPSGLNGQSVRGMRDLCARQMDGTFGVGTGSTTGNYFGRQRIDGEIVDVVRCDAAGTGTTSSVVVTVGDANGSAQPTNLNLFTWEILAYLPTRNSLVFFGSNSAMLWDCDGSTGVMRLVQPGSHVVGSSTTAPTLNAWRHLGLTYNGSKVFFYQNGAPDGSGTNGASWGREQHYIFSRGAAFGSLWSGGFLAYFAQWDRPLSDAEMARRARAPFEIFAPYARQRLYFLAAGGAGQTVTVNQALETDTAQAISRLKAKALGQSTETDLAQAITRRKTLAIGQALETDLAQAVTHAKAKLLGQATETDTAQAVAHAKTKALGQATETDLAQAITASGNKIIAVGQVTETDVAQSLTARKAKQLGQTTETDLAQAVAHAKTKALGQASETDLAQAITPSIPNQVGQAVETDTAQTITRLKAKALGQTTETDLAQAITHAKTKGLGLALEIDLGQPIALAPKRRLVAQATETDLAQTIVPSLSSVLLPQGKRYVVGARVGYRVGARNNFRVDQ